VIELRDVFVMVVWGSTSRCFPCVQLLLQLFSSDYAIMKFVCRLQLAEFVIFLLVMSSLVLRLVL
jgi:hypothetical protein